MSIKSTISLLAISFYAASAIAAPPVPCKEEVGVKRAGFGTYVQATATSNYYLKPGECLISANEKFMAVLQADDGNFVVYPLPGQSKKNAKWQSRTSGSPGAGLLVQQDGHAVIYRAGDIVTSADGNWNGKPNSKAPWVSNKASTPYDSYFLAMQDDGNLVLYRGSDPDNARGFVFNSFDDSKQKAATGKSPFSCPCNYRCVPDKNGITWCVCEPDPLLCRR